MEIRGSSDFEMRKVRLKSVRPFVMDQLVLGDIEGLDKQDKVAVTAVIKTKVDTMISQAKNDWIRSNASLDPDLFPKPLIRLKVISTYCIEPRNDY